MGPLASDTESEEEGGHGGQIDADAEAEVVPPSPDAVAEEAVAEEEYQEEACAAPTAAPTPAPDAAPLPSWVLPGGRVAIADVKSGTPEWYGATVDGIGEQIDGEWTIWFALDDGYAKQLTSTQIHEAIRAGGLKELTVESELGLIKNETGFPAAAKICWNKEGKAKAPTAVGVLLGATEMQIGGEPLYTGFRLNASSAGDGKCVTTRSGGTTTPTRKGFHTFLCGDKVVTSFASLEEGCGEHKSYEAIVVGVTFPIDNKGAKYLLLQEEESRIFFVGRWPDWTRKPLVAGRVNFDDEDDGMVEQLSPSQVLKMVDEFRASSMLASLEAPSKVKSAADKIQSKGPPMAQQEEVARRKETQDKKRKELGSKGGGRRGGRGNGRGRTSGRKKGAGETSAAGDMQAMAPSSAPSPAEAAALQKLAEVEELLQQRTRQHLSAMAQLDGQRSGLVAARKKAKLQSAAEPLQEPGVQVHNVPETPQQSKKPSSAVALPPGEHVHECACA